GYHRYLRTLLASYCASPALAQSVLLEFNFRWNLKMMVKNRGLPAELGEHYNQHLVEIIQRATADWDPSCPVFPQWPAAVDSVDTGERSGLGRSLWGGENAKAWKGAGHEASCAEVDDVDDVNGRTPLSHLTLSAKLYARMMGEKMPETRVYTREEKRKFREELGQNYWQPGGPMGRAQQYQRVNFDGWAVKWNAYCDQIQQGTVKWVPVHRKTAKQLEEYYAQVERSTNVTLTLYPHRDAANALRTELQRPADGSAFEGSVAQMQPVPVDLRKASIVGGGSLGSGPSGIVAAAAAAAARAAATARESTAQGGGASGAGAADSGSGVAVASSGAGGSGSDSGAPVTIHPAPAARGL
ncbi:unnamed protein product, partial [Ectocarpus sp. 8 AP-2014]